MFFSHNYLLTGVGSNYIGAKDSYHVTQEHWNVLLARYLEPEHVERIRQLDALLNRLLLNGLNIDKLIESCI